MISPKIFAVFLITRNRENKLRISTVALLWGASLLSTLAYGADDAQQAASVIKNMVAQQMKGDGNMPDWLKRTDINVEGMDQSKPTWSVETVQPLYQTPDTLRDTVFFQGRWGRRSSDNTFNLGLGYRRLLDDKSWLLGINGFYDTTTEYHHQRYGVGAEAIGQYVTFRTNYYKAISGDKTISTTNGVTETERALDGYDYEVDAPLPYLPWMRVAATSYRWKSATAGVSDSRGDKLTLRGNLSEHLSMELGRSVDNYSSGNFVKISYNFVGTPTNGVESTMFGNLKSAGAFEARDLTKHTLDKVQRQNDIIVQKTRSGSGGITIGRRN